MLEPRALILPRSRIHADPQAHSGVQLWFESIERLLVGNNDVLSSGGGDIPVCSSRTWGEKVDQCLDT